LWTIWPPQVFRHSDPPPHPRDWSRPKGFAKDFMASNGVATADYVRCQTVDEAFAALDRFGFPVVVKADGLAAGKGVLICEDRSEAEAAVNSVMVARDFGSAGNQLVIEECLTGWETSVIGIVDGSTFMSFLPAKDHKRAGEGDAGPNTGGMGVIAPHPQVDKAVWNDIKGNIIDPTMAGLVAEGLEYAGFLFIGVMVTSSGAKTLEYQCSLG
jgi:phosphoribosylamine--glycine ligase